MEQRLKKIFSDMIVYHARLALAAIRGRGRTVGFCAAIHSQKGRLEGD